MKVIEGENSKNLGGNPPFYFEFIGETKKFPTWESKKFLEWVDYKVFKGEKIEKIMDLSPVTGEGQNINDEFEQLFIGNM